MQITVAMGRAADELDVLLQPYHLLDLFPLLSVLKERADRARGVGHQAKCPAVPPKTPTK
jgi:hypothetical protein